MTFEITLQPSLHRFLATPDETLLEAGLRQDVGLPHGCRDGACGACKAKIVSGEIDHGFAQEQALSATERASGVALLCCARARSDLVIACRETAGSGIPARLLPARVQRMGLLAPDVMALFLKLPAGQRLPFRAGQYIDILLKDGKRRSYSIANAPHDDEFIELHLRRIPGGLFTKHVFAGMKERDIVRLSGPHGTFFLHDESTKPIVLVAGGTGFAPIKAIVEHLLHVGSRRPVDIYRGERTRQGLYLNALPEAWAAAHPGIRYTPVLSEPSAGDRWPGRTGLVHLAVVEDFPRLADHQVYVCGGPAMIEAARRDFTSRCALPEEDFFADAFSYAATISPASANE